MASTSAIIALALVSSVDALVGRSSSCCFGLTASGGPGGPVVQLGGGQTRIGQNLDPSSFCIKDGALSDAHGRGCIVTPPTSQIQCDQGAAATEGFALGCDGSLSWFAESRFWSCPTGDNGGFNLYATPPPDQQGCVPVSLKSDGCHNNCPVPIRPPPPPKTCPADLSGDFEFPHLIIPIDPTHPDTAYGTSFNGQVTATVSSLFNFDIPQAASGKTCSLVFLFPHQEKLTTSSYTSSGDGHFDFSLLSQPADHGSTFNNAPYANTTWNVSGVLPGSSHVIATFGCPGGDAIGIQMESKGDSNLVYFQDYNPDPIGLYITSCHKLT